MATVARIRGQTPKFKAWLTARGASVGAPTNEWELIRFDADNGVNVIYHNKRGEVTFCGRSEQAWDAFRSSGAWSAGVRSARHPMGAKVRALIERDGRSCFYCAEDCDDEHVSAEHLVAVVHGGPKHMSNLVLAHPLCNSEMGHLPVIEKIKRHHDVLTLRMLRRIEIEMDRDIEAWSLPDAAIVPMNGLRPINTPR